MPPRIGESQVTVVPSLALGLRGDLGAEELTPGEAEILINYDLTLGGVTPRRGFARYLSATPDGLPIIFIDMVKFESNWHLLISTRDHVYCYDGSWIDVTPAYITGTVTTVNGSSTVTGAAAGWTAVNVQAASPINDTFIDLNGVEYAIIGLNVGAQTITISPAYAGAGGAGQAYEIVQKLYTTGELPTVQGRKSVYPSPGAYLFPSAAPTYYWAPRGMCAQGISVKRNRLLKWTPGGTSVPMTLDISGNAGIGWGGAKPLVSASSIDVTELIGGPADMWGGGYTPANFSNANFRLRLTKSAAGGTFYLDRTRVKVYYRTPGTAGSTGPLPPTACAQYQVWNQWSNPARVYVHDGLYANPDNASQNSYERYYNFGIVGAVLPISGITVTVHGRGLAPDGTLHVALTWNNGVQRTAEQPLSWPSGGPPIFTDGVAGSPTDTWGHTWTWAQLADALFGVIIWCDVGEKVYVDYITVRVYYGVPDVDSDTGFLAPTATGAVDNDFTNPANAYVSDDTYATETAAGDAQDYYNFTLGVPLGTTILGVEVEVEHHRMLTITRMAEVALPAAYGHAISIGVLANHLVIGGMYDNIGDTLQLRSLAWSDFGSDTAWTTGEAQVAYLVDSAGSIIDLARAEQLSLLVFKEDQLVYITWVGPPTWITAQVIPFEAGGWRPAKLGMGWVFINEELGPMMAIGRNVQEAGQRGRVWRNGMPFSFFAINRVPPIVEEWRDDGDGTRVALLMDQERGAAYSLQLADGFMGGGEFNCARKLEGVGLVLYGASDGYLYTRGNPGADYDVAARTVGASLYTGWMDLDYPGPKEITGVRLELTRPSAAEDVTVTVEVSEDRYNVGDTYTATVNLGTVRPMLVVGSQLKGYFVKLKIDDPGNTSGYRIHRAEILWKPRAI